MQGRIVTRGIISKICIKIVQQPPKRIKIKWKGTNLICAEMSHTATDTSNLGVKFSLDVFQLDPTLTSSTTSGRWTHLNSNYTAFNPFFLSNIRKQNSAVLLNLLRLWLDYESIFQPCLNDHKLSKYIQLLQCFNIGLVSCLPS